MARWEPDAMGRLQKAAMELFGERGYARTTVEDIAARAGLTERTFFRYFVDKREVLFSGATDLETSLVKHIAGAPRDARPFPVVVSALGAAGGEVLDGRDLHWVRARAALVAQHAELLERELIKRAALGRAIRKALQARGVSAHDASLVAETGLAVFAVGFERWLRQRKPGDFASHVRAAARRLEAVVEGDGFPA